MATLSKDREMHHRTGRASRCRHSKDRAKQTGTGIHAADAFLKTQFLPLWQTKTDTIPEDMGLERDFFTSLSYLSALYEFEPMDVSTYTYPFNILLSHHDAERKIRSANKVLDLFIVRNDQRKTFLATKEVCDTGRCLYYVPVLPLYRMQRNKQTHRGAALLFPVMTYLCKIAGVPYYRDEGCYMYYEYDMVIDWIIDCREEWDEQDYKRVHQEIKDAKRLGDKMGTVLYDRKQLQDWHNRLLSFRPVTEADYQCQYLSETAYKLYCTYPERHLLANMEEVTHDDYGDPEQVAAEQYISFIADHKGYLFEQLSESVNCRLQELYGMQEPAMIQIFDGKQDQKATSLDFEQRMFTLLDNLISVLRQY